MNRIMAFHRNYSGYPVLEIGATLSPSLALALADLQRDLLAALWPHSTAEQRRFPLLVSYHLFIALLPLALLSKDV